MEDEREKEDYAGVIKPRHRPKIFPKRKLNGLKKDSVYGWREKVDKEKDISYLCILREAAKKKFFS